MSEKKCGYKKQKIPGSVATGLVAEQPYGYAIDYDDWDVWINWEKETIKKTEKSCCKNPRVYENVLSNDLRFWVCSSCKKEVEKPKNSLTQQDIDKLFDPN